MPDSTIKIKLVRSPHGRPKKQREIIRGLGLKKLHQTVERPNNRATRGMIKKVIHMVEVKE